MGEQDESALKDYERTTTELQDALLRLQKDGVDIIPPMLAMGDIYARVTFSNFGFRMAKELEAQIKLRLEKLNLEQSEDLPRC